MNNLSSSGLIIIIIGIILGGYFIPISAENNIKEQRQQCIDEYIFVVYDFMQRENVQDLVFQIYMIDWMERCHDIDWDITKPEFFDRVKELGYELNIGNASHEN